MDVLFLNIIFSLSACCHAHTRICVYVCVCVCVRVCVDMHMIEYGYGNGWLVTEGDNCCVDDGNDKCFTMMMMIIRTVVLVFHPSVLD